jgi:hypothetical protein
MRLSLASNDGFRATVEKAVAGLVRAERIRETFFVNLPMVYPDGSFVTVRIDPVTAGARVSDAGFAFREVEDIGANRSFKRTANRIADKFCVEVSEKAIFTTARYEELERAICDVAAVSWRVVSEIYEKQADEVEAELADELSIRLKSVFGADKVFEGDKLLGASTTEWPVSATVIVGGHRAAFQAVIDHPNSIYRTSTAFKDIASLGKDIRLIAFVKSKAAIGPKLQLLSPGRVVEEGQSNDLLEKAAA